jgi:hypothetical protein
LGTVLERRELESLLVRSYGSKEHYSTDRYALYQAGWLVRDVQVQRQQRWWLPGWLAAGLPDRLSPLGPRFTVTYVLVEADRRAPPEGQPSIYDDLLLATQAELHAVRRERDQERARRQRSEAELHSLRAELDAIRAAEGRIPARIHAQTSTRQHVPVHTRASSNGSRPSPQAGEDMLAILREWADAEDYAASQD